MAGNVTGTTATTADLIAEVWTKEVTKPFDKALQFAKLVQRRDGLVSGGGDTIHVPFSTHLTARTKAASTDVTYDNDLGTPLTISIDKHAYSAVKIEDFAKVQSNYNLQSIFRERQAEAVARQIDTDLAGLYADADNSVSGGATVDDADVLAVVQFLDGADVPRSQRYGVIHSEAENDLLNVNKYVAYDQTGQKGVAVADGLVSRLYGMDLYLSNNVTEEAGTPNLLHNVFFWKNALTLAQQLAPTYKMEDSVDSIAMKTVLHTIYGIKTERPEAVVDLQLNS
jgi:N4-gp56 family major capsid protein